MTEQTDMKHKIFVKAAELFGTYSYSRVSMRDIAGALGIKSPSIYYHYTSKEEILKDLLNYFIDYTVALREKALKRMGEPGYQPRLEDIEYPYPEGDRQLMYWITRITLTEQFTVPLAADALVGLSSQYYRKGHERFFQVLEEKGIVSEENRMMYHIMMARLAYSYQLDFAHPEFPADSPTLHEMHPFLLEMILDYEGTREHLEAIVGGGEQA